MTFGGDDFDPTRPNLDLSQGELEPIHDRLAEIATAHGLGIPYNDMYPVTPDLPRPITLGMQIDSSVAKAIFHPDDDQLLPDEGSSLNYSQPHLLYPTANNPNNRVVENVTIALKWRLAGSEVRLCEYYWLTKNQGMLSASVESEYTENKKRISLNILERDKLLTHEEVIELLGDMEILERPFTIDDAEKVRELIEVLGA